MSRIPLMSKATAVWLVENTTMTFKQIAEFCHLHELEVKGIADGDVATGVRGLDPVTGGQLTREEIAKAEPTYWTPTDVQEAISRAETDTERALIAFRAIAGQYRQSH